MSRRRTILLVLAFVLLIVLGAGWFYGLHDRGLNRELDAQRIASAETRMWQAYYGSSKRVLATELVTILREQFGLSYSTAGLVARDLASAAMNFSGQRANYEQDVLPHLEAAYGRIHDAVRGKWDPKEVARAELAWWAARRDPTQNSPEQIGAIIAYEYALLYGDTNEHIQRAGLLRAQAGRLRDQGGKNANWSQVEKLLTESYEALLTGVGG